MGRNTPPVGGTQKAMNKLLTLLNAEAVKTQAAFNGKYAEAAARIEEGEQKLRAQCALIQQMIDRL